MVLAEGGTLAHPTRCAKLAELAARTGAEVVYGTSREYLPYVGQIPSASVVEISSPPTAEVLRRLDAGKFFATADELSQQFDENLRLLKEVRPTVAIGDARMTLPMACQRANVPCASLVNHHWSPFLSSRYPVPDSRPTRLFGVRLASLLSRFVTPALLDKAIQPLNDVRAAHRFPPYEGMRAAYCDGDWVLYVGLPSQAKPEFPQHHVMIGPLVWERTAADAALRATLADAPKPVVFASLGSSGDPTLLPSVVSALAGWNGTLVATHPDPASIRALRPTGTLVETFVPIADALKVADLVIGNGGTATVLASLVAGTPYMALYTNLDQALSVEQYRQTGAVFGDLSLSMPARRIRTELGLLLETPGPAAAARRCRDAFAAAGGDDWTVRQLARIVDFAAHHR
jgi:UDP:flavonoid glycosyltransferase YjiC (YdhE family)